MREAEALARLFHAIYERLAPEHGYKTRDASAVPWEDVPDDNKRLMIATAVEVLKQWNGGQSMNENLLKSLTGAESITPRVLGTCQYRDCDSDASVTLSVMLPAWIDENTYIEAGQREQNICLCTEHDALIRRQPWETGGIEAASFEVPPNP